MKRIILTIIVMLYMFSTVSLAGCLSSTLVQQSDAQVTEEKENPMESISGYPYLVYDKETLVVYYKTTEADGYRGYGFMTAYLGEHGHPCRYVDGKIVEIEE